jgi:putative addiction module component (TIGR02574 family)
MEQASHTIDRGKLLDEALSLSEADRAYLAQSLQDSLPESYNWVAHLRPDVRQAWREEIRRRLKEIDEGRAVVVDGDEVMRRLKDRYRHEAQVP